MISKIEYKMINSPNTNFIIDTNAINSALSIIQFFYLLVSHRSLGFWTLMLSSNAMSPKAGDTAGKGGIII